MQCFLALLACFSLIVPDFVSSLLEWNCRNFTGPPFEIQCPTNFSFWTDEGFVIKLIKSKRIEIDCYKMETFRFDWLPNVSLEGVNSIYLNSCPVAKNFKSIANHFLKEQIKEFKLSSVVNVTLTKTHFEGFQSLTSLRLRRVTFQSSDEKLLDNTPNLDYLEIENNKNLKLDKNFFKNTPLLQRLYLSMNHMVDVPKHLFKNLNKLRILHMISNNLTKLNQDTFNGLISLESLELTNNLIEIITENAFECLTQLTDLNLQQNYLSKIPSNLFRNNKNLKIVLLAFNPNITIPDYLFANLSSLEIVDLSFCNLNHLPEHVFQNAVNIRTLKLNKNNFTHLDKNAFKGLNLEELELEHNYISVIEKDLLRGWRLKKINLRKNQIKTIQYGAFNDKSNLREIVLSHNRLSKGNIFEDTRNLQRIDLSFNNISRITDVVVLYNLPKLKKLDLSHNFIKEIMMTNLRALTTLEVNLRYNNVTKISFDKLDNINSSVNKTTILLEKNPIMCNCEIYDFLQFLATERFKNHSKLFDISIKNLTCFNPPELKNVQIRMLSPSNLTCLRENISEKCSYNWRPYDHTLVVNCSFKNLTIFPEIDFSKISSLGFNQTEMHLEGNHLTSWPDSKLPNYENVTLLYLSHNKIETISWLPPKLKVLQLHNNQIRQLDFKILNLIESSKLVNLTLNHNPWKCDCETANLTNFLRHNSKILDARHIYCFNSTNRLIELNQTDLCDEWQVVYLALTVVAVLFFIAFIFAFYYRYQQELKIWLFAHNSCLWWITEEEVDKDKIYDAFISYSHKDEDFVTENLLPVLEGGPQPYKLCLHYRNWIPGEFITTQVTNSVLESRRTLVVLSPNFLESVWGKMEFRTAHTQAMTEGRARVIIVLYGDVDVDSLDDELKTYLKTNTYVKWGDPYFWKKLKYALPHSRKNGANNQKIANIMNCIDKNFKLVAPVINCPGSISPVLARDPNMLKHPLNFVSSQKMDTPSTEAGLLRLN